MNIVETLIGLLVTALGQSDIFVRIKHQIRKIEDTDPDKPGLEKKATLIQELKIIGIETTGLLLNVLIELGCLVIKAKIPVVAPVVDVVQKEASHQLSDAINAFENLQS